MNLGKINKIYSYALWASLFFERSIWSLYLIQQGITYVEIGILQTLLATAMFIFELPSGFLSDKFGEKFTLNLGHLLNIGYLALLLCFPNFFMLMIAFLMYGMGFAMISGSDQTMLYNYDNGQEYSKKIGIYNAIMIVGLAFSSFMGGIISNYSWYSVFILGIVSQLISLGILFTIKASSGKRELEEQPMFTDVFKSFRAVFKGNYSIVYLLCSVVLFQSILSVLYNFMQLLLTEKGLPIVAVSTILSIGLLLSTVSSLSMDFLNKVFGRKKLLSVFLLLLFLSGLLFRQENYYMVIGAFFFFIFTYELVDVTLNTVLHGHANDESRTSFISFINSLTSLSMILFNSIFTLLMNVLKVETIFMLGVTACSLATLIFLFAYTRTNKKKNKI